MEPKDYWSRKTNPETGGKFEHFKKYMECTQNGKADIDALLATEYGCEMTRMLELRFRFEEQPPMCPAVLDYYGKIGISKQMFGMDDFFKRWALFSPIKLNSKKRYPLLIWNHGGKETIEEEEYVTHLIPNAAKEEYIVIMAQDTSWENIVDIIGQAGDIMPIDLERVYIGGFSQGGRLAGAAALNAPEKFAAVVLNGGPIFDTTDNHGKPFHLLQIQHMTEMMVPFLQIQNQCDVSNVVPLNVYRPRQDTPHVDNRTYVNPEYSMEKDPTYLYSGTTRERINPPQQGDVRYWLMDLLNLRMATLHCDFRDPQTCIDYADAAEDEFHRTLGFYGDEERTELLYGVKHYMVDIFSREGLNTFRYIMVANTNHWPPVTLGELMWDFCRQFRRDAKTGAIVHDVYRAAEGQT